MLTPSTVIPTLFALGLFCIPIGIAVTVTSDAGQGQGIEIDYTSCSTKAPLDPSPLNAPSQATKWSYDPETNTCTLYFTLAKEMMQNVFMYYRLTNFYQNLRKTSNSRSEGQLLGEALPYDKLISTDSVEFGCAPQDTSPNFNEDNVPDFPVYYPCGKLANNYFLDLIQNPVLLGKNGRELRFSSENIAWPTERQKYRKTTYDLSAILPPPNWRTAGIPHNYTQLRNGRGQVPDLSKNERFMNWMKVSTANDLLKLYGRLDRNMPAGNYSIQITDLYPVATRYSGSKALVIDNTTILGGSQSFLGIVYIIVGLLCTLLGFVFLAIQITRPRRLGDHFYLSWNQAISPPPRPNESL